MLRSLTRQRLPRSTLSTRAVVTRQFAHKTHVVERELPKAPSTKSRTPYYIGGAILGCALWGVGLGAALNYQRLSSSVVKGTMFMVRYDPRVIALLGDKIDYADSWPWITGTVNHLKGEVAIAFDVAGATGERGRVRFSSLRRGTEWVTVEFNITRETDGTTVELGQLELTDTGAPATSQ
ncbi:cytochrome oxidase complex assembly protein 1-domain-containing protein [Syncephalastrum racemosum]|uniref:Cytochrome oxidase complex assembly protein 1-domain-containing protein n=1 Tax=Syncephalastrum racemosum TaxID=13706 RepID=A0A1X2HGA3_SYNRA|nr:cytochrome oxidase complex assembly protein 1-domain-containing protein [Syncephalastrum racemosum]